MITYENERRAREVASKLMDAFCWGHTSQGHDYWSRIHKELLELKATPVKTEKEKTLEKIDGLRKQIEDLEKKL